MLWGKKKWERARTYTYIDNYIYNIIYLYIPHTYSLHYDTKSWFYLTQHQAQLIQVSVTFQKRFSGKHFVKKMHPQTWSRWSHMVRPYACKIRSVTRVSRREINWPPCETLLMVCAGCSCQHVLSLFLQATLTKCIVSKCAMCKHVLPSYCVSVRA